MASVQFPFTSQRSQSPLQRRTERVRCADRAPGPGAPLCWEKSQSQGRAQDFQRRVPQAWCREGCSDIYEGRRSLRLALHPPLGKGARRPSHGSCLLAQAPGAGSWDAFVLAAASLLPSSTCCDPGHLSRHRVIHATSCMLSYLSHRQQVSYESLFPRISTLSCLSCDSFMAQMPRNLVG